MTEDQKPSQELTLQQHAEQELTALQAGVLALRERYRYVVFDVETTKGMEDAKKARAEIRKPRYDAQNIIKAKKSELARISRDLGSLGQAVIDQIMEIEEPIDQQIEAVETRKAAEREAREAAAKAERQRQLDRVIGIRAVPSNLIGATVAEIDTATTVLLEDSLADLDDVFRPDGMQARDDAITALQVMRAQRADADAQAEELRQLREQQAAREAELAEQRQREDAERTEREQAEAQRRERDEAIAVAIDSLRAYAHMGRTSAEILGVREELDGIAINADTYGDRVEAATLARSASRGTLNVRHEQAVDAERERAEATERQRQLDEQAAEQRRKAEEAEAAELERQRAEELERAQAQRDAQQQAIRDATLRQAAEAALALLDAEGYEQTWQVAMLKSALLKEEA